MMNGSLLHPVCPEILKIDIISDQDLRIFL